jgi:hypothetical protein
MGKLGRVIKKLPQKDATSPCKLRPLQRIAHILLQFLKPVLQAPLDQMSAQVA